MVVERISAGRLGVDFRAGQPWVGGGTADRQLELPVTERVLRDGMKGPVSVEVESLQSNVVEGRHRGISHELLDSNSGVAR
jgi:hypothetical protein